MNFTYSLTIAKEAQVKSLIVHNFFEEINDFIKEGNYGNGILQYFISLYIINPPITQSCSTIKSSFFKR